MVKNKGWRKVLSRVGLWVKKRTLSMVEEDQYNLFANEGY